MLSPKGYAKLLFKIFFQTTSLKRDVDLWSMQHGLIMLLFTTIYTLCWIIPFILVTVSFLALFDHSLNPDLYNLFFTSRFNLINAYSAIHNLVSNMIDVIAIVLGIAVCIITSKDISKGFFVAVVGSIIGGILFGILFNISLNDFKDLPFILVCGSITAGVTGSIAKDLFTGIAFSTFFGVAIGIFGGPIMIAFIGLYGSLLGVAAYLITHFRPLAQMFIFIMPLSWKLNPLRWHSMVPYIPFLSKKLYYAYKKQPETNLTIILSLLKLQPHYKPAIIDTINHIVLDKLTRYKHIDEIAKAKTDVAFLSELDTKDYNKKWIEDLLVFSFDIQEVQLSHQKNTVHLINAYQNILEKMEKKLNANDSYSQKYHFLIQHVNVSWQEIIRKKIAKLKKDY